MCIWSIPALWCEKVCVFRYTASHTDTLVRWRWWWAAVVWRTTENTTIIAISKHISLTVKHLWTTKNHAVSHWNKFQKETLMWCKMLLYTIIPSTRNFIHLHSSMCNLAMKVITWYTTKKSTNSSFILHICASLCNDLSLVSPYTIDDKQSLPKQSILLLPFTGKIFISKKFAISTN